MKNIISVIILVLIANQAFSQNNQPNKYPTISGYIGTVIPVLSINKNETSTNFTSEFLLGIPIGININKSESLSYTTEITPVLSFTDKSSSVVNLAILSGVLLSKNNFTYGIRAAFETGGRYGMSLSALKSIYKQENYNIVIGLPLDIRLGKSLPASFGTGLILVIVI